MGVLCLVAAEQPDPAPRPVHPEPLDNRENVTRIWPTVDEVTDPVDHKAVGDSAGGGVRPEVDERSGELIGVPPDVADHRKFHNSDGVDPVRGDTRLRVRPAA